jgi:hypothetical protein
LNRLPVQSAPSRRSEWQARGPDVVGRWHNPCREPLAGTTRSDQTCVRCSPDVTRASTPGLADRKTLKRHPPPQNTTVPTNPCSTPSSGLGTKTEAGPCPTSLKRGILATVTSAVPVRSFHAHAHALGRVQNTQTTHCRLQTFPGHGPLRPAGGRCDIAASRLPRSPFQRL